MSQKTNKSLLHGARAEMKGRKGPKKIEDNREHALQAVVIADCFETRFNPFTLETPRCLLPVANTPLIEYTLEFLAMSGVAEVYIYCGTQATAVESYMLRSRWHPSIPASPFQVLENIKTSVRSVGDVMRDLDSRDLITGDFILVYGDLVSNICIRNALATHRARKQADKNAIMTMLLRTGGLDKHRTKSKGVSPVFVIDPTINRCLHYEEMHPMQANKYINLDSSLLTEHSELEVLTDLIDCGIDICTPDVLALWAESFDYEISRRHFLHGVLKDYELNGKKIHTEIIDDHYAARVSNLQSYEAVSKDILGRWTYPFVPDSNLVAGQTYKVERGGLCKENGVILARTCKTGRRTVLGRDTSLGDGSTISSSIIGRRCRIGNNVHIQNAYIWDDVVIDDGTTIDRAIVANNASIGKNCKIEPGSLVSYGVRIADGIVVSEGHKITCFNHNPNDGSEPTKLSLTDPSAVGEGGQGYLWEEDSDCEDEASFFQSSLIYSTAHLNISDSSISTFASTVSNDGGACSDRRHPSFTGSIISDTDGTAGNEGFHYDAVNGLLDTLRENGDFDSAKLEFMGLRLSNDATDHQIRRAIAVAFTKRIAQLVEHEKLEALKATTHAFSTPGAEKFLREVAIGIDRRIDDQVDFIICLQKDLLHRASGATILAAMSQDLYTRDILEEGAFLLWWELGERLGADEVLEMSKIRERTGVFIKWLKEAESESSSGDSSSGSEGDDEEDED
ncbi:translation initiation factor eif-2b epsilon subunit [Blumeria hordei DH14]|uniref:Mannose-1-phosphate guanyltransferase n=1 Tax=Blumeria graminis f. sp. hordei (strain DH14) TaxID=546991 RepID=N1JDC4_BLUG1|nr:translation initiation factor eif-2b epsilon subunit [Blumeria hordei DH14]